MFYLLAKSSINNKLISPSFLKYWKSTDIFTGKGTINDDDIIKGLDDIMYNTTLKRACCLGNSGKTDTVKVDTAAQELTTIDQKKINVVVTEPIFQSHS